MVDVVTPFSSTTMRFSDLEELEAGRADLEAVVRRLVRLEGRLTRGRAPAGADHTGAGRRADFDTIGLLAGMMARSRARGAWRYAGRLRRTATRLK